MPRRFLNEQDVFDQPGVELGKVLAKPIERALQENDHSSAEFDSITAARIHYFQKQALRRCCALIAMVGHLGN